MHFIEYRFISMDGGNNLLKTAAAFSEITRLLDN
jgi:hypothetical protein